MIGALVFSQEDIRRILSAAEQATNAAVGANGDPDDVYSRGYVNGYRAALTTIALAAGLLVQPRGSRDGHHMQCPAKSETDFGCNIKNEKPRLMGRGL